MDRRLYIGVFVRVRGHNSLGRMKVSSAAAVSTVALAVAACSPMPEWAGTIEERDGVTYVTNPRKGLWESRDHPPIQFELEQVFGVDRSPEEAIVGQPVGTVVDNDGNVYLLDWQANELMSFAPDGSLRFRAGRPGQGPGELYQAVAMAWDGRASLFVANIGGTRIDRWTTDGEFDSSVALSELGLPRAFGVEMLEDDQLVLSVPDIRSVATEYVIVSLGEPWQIMRRFRVRAEPEIDLSVPIILALPDAAQHGLLSVGSIGSYVLRRYDLSGRLLMFVERPREYLPSKGFTDTSGVAGSTGSYASVNAPRVLSSGYWIVVARWPGSNEITPEKSPGTTYWSSSLDVFDPKGRFLGSYEGSQNREPSLGRPVAVGPDDHLYTVADEPFPQIRRYRVEIEP